MEFMGHKITTCTFCGVGCGLYLETDGRKIQGVYPSITHPTNRGKICVRGWHVHEVASSPDRLNTPLIRKNGEFEPVSWEEAISFIANRLTEIRQKHGPNSITFLCSPRCSNEEAYLLQKFARVIIGTNNIDHGTGVYGNNSINVLMEMLGVPASTNSIEELDKSEVIIVDDVDLAKQLPTIGGRVIRSHLNGTKLIVIDSRRHRVAESADIFLQIRPGTEYVLYAAMCKIIYDKGLYNREFIKAKCKGAEEFIKSIQRYDSELASKVCGIPMELVEEAAIAYSTAKSAAILYSTGIENRRVESIQASVNLALLTGRIGKESSGVFALTEHNNLQDVCDMGMLRDKLPGYYPVSEPEGRSRIESIWGKNIPSTAGLDARQSFSGSVNGGIKAAWLCRYDPVSTAVFADAASSLKKMELVIVQHLFKTATAEYADVILPSTAFGEEEVTFTSTERRVQIASQAIEPLEGTKPSWQQIMMVAQAMGEKWDYKSGAEVMEEIRRVVPFYSAASYQNLSIDYGRQWPCTVDKPLGTRTLFIERIPKNKFKLIPMPEPPASAFNVDQQYPLQLFFGNSLYYWHRNVLIQHSETLKREYRILLLDYPEGFVEINPEDGKKLGIRDGEKVRLVTAIGSAVVAARLTDEIREGTVFVPYFLREVKEQLLANGQDYVALKIEKLNQ